MTTLKNYGPINLDLEGLVKGMEVICKECNVKEPEYEAAMTLGMLPAPVMLAFDSELKLRIPDKFIIKGDPLTTHDGKFIRSRITNDVVVKILQNLKEEGKLHG